ncbi:isocyanide synthase family protein, partial [Aspergillus glaucus CBS 516.65]
LDVLQTYFWKAEDDAGGCDSYWPGRENFKGHVVHWMELGEPVRMALPAFPFKSTNMDKVLGVLPDYAEYLGLCRLNQMCVDVREFYSPGAEVTIAADGVVFNDLLMVSDEDVWNYGQAVREMVQKNGFDQNLKVVHAMEILFLAMIDPTTKSTKLTEEIFYKTIDSSRDLIINGFCQSENDTQKLVDEDIDSRLTYNGMRAFVKIDLANTSIRKNAASKKDYLNEMSTLALKMMGRSEGFGKLIRAAMPHHVRLSIHPSYGTAKLSICLVPQLPGFTARAPWMSCIAVDRQGANHTAHARDVRVTHQLVVENGMPWMFVER